MKSIASVLVACLAWPAGAEIVSFEYQAVVGNVGAPFAGIATAGDPVFGRITFDTATADSDPDPTTGVYLGATHEITIGSYSGVSTQSFVRIFDDGSMPAFDAFQVVDFAPGDEFEPVDGLPLDQLTLAINASTDLYASDTLPAAPPALGDPRVSDAFVGLFVTPPGSGSTPLFSPLTALPEPSGGVPAATVALLALAARSRTKALRA